MNVECLATKEIVQINDEGRAFFYQGCFGHPEYNQLQRLDVIGEQGYAMTLNGFIDGAGNQVYCLDPCDKLKLISDDDRVVQTITKSTIQTAKENLVPTIREITGNSLIIIAAFLLVFGIILGIKSKLFKDLF